MVCGALTDEFIVTQVVGEEPAVEYENDDDEEEETSEQPCAWLWRRSVSRAVSLALKAAQRLVSATFNHCTGHCFPSVSERRSRGC